MKRNIAVILIMLICQIFVLSACSVEITETTPNVSKEEVGADSSDYEYIELWGPYEVKRVVDGDTIVVIIDDEDVKVRLIGVNTPESVHNDESKNTKEGKEASIWTTELLTDQDVYLEYDVESEDKYGRALAYVYLDDMETMVNQLLIENGLATTMTIKPNVKYADLFYECIDIARDNNVGFWGTGYFD